MISRRLTKTQKAEILEAYREGDNTNVLAEKYHCTPNTINRTVKTLLSEYEYTLLKKKRSKNSNKKDELVGNEKVKQKEGDLEQASLLISCNENVKEEDALLVLQRSQEVKVLKLHKASIISGESEKSYNLEIIYVAG